MAFPVLKIGSCGPEVQQAQTLLAAHGFRTGRIDGIFGESTHAAVIAFQRSEGMLADGIIGPRTAAALGIGNPAPVPTIIPGVTVQSVCEIFPRTPRANIEKHLPAVLKALIAPELTEKCMVLTALATIRAETESFLPISERISRSNTSPGGHPFDLYDYRKDLGNKGAGDGERFKGRGFVQLTGRANYMQQGAAIGLGDQLVEDPDLANDPVIAARLLASFLKSRELAIKDALLQNDLRATRRLVNGGSNGLDRFADAYQRGEALIPDAPPISQRAA
jgi:peptidoglycan L-alanyl-D-glutamate endopeptidase CwlK